MVYRSCNKYKKKIVNNIFCLLFQKTFEGENNEKMQWSYQLKIEFLEKDLEILQ